ncbi:PEGA domain-containing protein, partial [Corallococcus sp. 4LFB]|uniref:PEGA domain-containing protein n=1 Tax=Corallococcus sp. 4LFB TaxID=3383249 RepID=UPI003976366D
PAAAAEPAVAARRPPPAPSASDVESDPPGAEVKVNGRVRGNTPLTITHTPDSPGLADVEVSFAMDGYQTVSKTYSGEPGTTVNVSIKLPRIKKQAPKPSPKAPSSSYKDDPYQ